MIVPRQIQREVDRKVGKILKRLSNQGLDAALDYIEQLRATHSPIWNEELTEQLNALSAVAHVLQDRVD